MDDWEWKGFSHDPGRTEDKSGNEVKMVKRLKSLPFFLPLSTAFYRFCFQAKKRARHLPR